MKFELKDFQVTSARSILTKLGQARESVAQNELEAIVLSAPTGSGKTITVAAVIDWMFGGTDGIPARPNTTFLWLSDSPELNAQSKGKLLAACDHVPFHRMVTVESDSFDAERLKPGYVYFINTQLLGKDKLLTKRGDKKAFTFWETVANTVGASPQDLVLIIDEAHRGTSVTDRARKPIMQKFVTGSEVDGLPAIPLVLGMSATPQRFTELLGNTTRTQRPVNISPEMVRESGLLKDLIVVTNPRSKTQSDLTLLESAADRWKHFSELWAAYCEREKVAPLVRPILVVQVEDGRENLLTRTPLHDVVRVLERAMGQLGDDEVVHCFQDKAELQFGGRRIRHIDASRIQETPGVKVVLFKTALTTGWDCPRAEVMMSFRRAQDPTSIAQLVGRMIRTPLARRIESDEVLNTVDLFLPHYDSDALEGVLARLRSPDEQDSAATDVATKVGEYARNALYSDVFAHLERLPTYSVNRAPKMSEVKRALRLAGLLVHEGIEAEADERLRERLTKRLNELAERYAAEDAEWAKTVRAGGEIEVDVTSVAVGLMNVAGKRTTRLVLSDENVDHLFESAGRLLAVGEGLHRTYWKRFHDRSRPSQAKLELFALMQRPETLVSVETLAKEEFDRMWESHRSAIRKLPTGERARFQRLLQSSGKAVVHEWELPEKIVERKGPQKWEKHLFIDAEEQFETDLNTWEVDFIKWAMEQKDFYCWLRNPDRRDWALCIPYEMGGERPFYPDFVLIRRTANGFEVDVLEPHDDSRLDTWAKVKGMARFAESHHMDYGRLMVGRIKAGKMQVVDVAVSETRGKAMSMGAPADLEALFEEC